MEVFRRGCLKGTLYVQRSALCCKCERNHFDCAKRNQGWIFPSFTGIFRVSGM